MSARSSPTVDKLPPFNVEAEESVIASLLVDDEALDKVLSLIGPEHFYRDTTRWAFEACLALAERNEGINQITVAHELARRGRLEEVGGAAFLSRLTTELPTPIGVEYYAGIVRDLAVHRQLITAAGRIAQWGFSLNGNTPAELLDKADAELVAVREMAQPILASKMDPSAISLDQLLVNTHGTVEWLVDGLLVHSALNIVGGDAETAKTFAKQDLELAIASGQSWLGRPVRQGRVLVVDEENDADLYGERLPGLLRGRAIDHELDSLHYVIGSGIDLSSDRGMYRLKAEIRGVDPAVVTLETLGMLRGRFDENSATDMSEFTRRLRHLREVNGHAQVLTHHLSKPGRVPRDLLRGSTQIRAAGDSILEFNAMLPGGPFAIRHTKSRRARRQPNSSFAIEERPDGGIVLAALQPSAAGGSYETLARDNLETLLLDGEWHAQADVLAACQQAAPGAPEETLRRGLSRALAVLEKDGRLERRKVGRHAYLRAPE